MRKIFSWENLEVYAWHVLLCASDLVRALMGGEYASKTSLMNVEWEFFGACYLAFQPVVVVS